MPAVQRYQFYRFPVLTKEQGLHFYDFRDNLSVRQSMNEREAKARFNFTKDYSGMHLTA